ncbi:MAG TPA: PepSY-associated TM helix domain-containing protein [Woeseiaceae bacterium]
MWRKTIFWVHLTCGVTAGLVILMMSATGVLLTYERQMLGWAERQLVSEPGDARRLGIAELLQAARKQEPAFAPSSVTLSAHPRAPVELSAGRGNTRLVDPYTALIVGDGEGGLHAFFDAVRGWHRWFNAEGEHRDLARAATGACNLAFLFLVLSGMYLWLPPVFNRAALRVRFWFNPRAGTGKARDYNWHHVFGIWSAVPLAVIVASATVFNYEWANAAVYRFFGEEPPARRGAAASTPPSALADSSAGELHRLDRLVARAAAAVPGWQRLTLELPETGAAAVEVAVDRGTGGQPQLRHDLVLDRATGEVLANERFAGTPARRARSMLRFLHTGEALGWAGQTVAGIVSATSTVMVWTGLALAWRRLVRPLLARRSAVRSAGVPLPRTEPRDG